MDEIDVKILKILSNSGRSTASEISKAVHLSIPAVSERIRKLEESGVINGYTARLSRACIGMPLTAFVQVSVHSDASLAAAICTDPAVLECHRTAGEFDYILKLALRDLSHLDSFLFALHSCKAVAKVHTSVVLATEKETLSSL